MQLDIPRPAPANQTLRGLIWQVVGTFALLSAGGGHSPADWDIVRPGTIPF